VIIDKRRVEDMENETDIINEKNQKVCKCGNKTWLAYFSGIHYTLVLKCPKCNATVEYEILDW